MSRFISHKRLAKDAHRVLADLGTSPEEVALSLLSYGVHVWYENNSADPLVLYLNAVMGADRRVRSVEVAGRWAQIRTGKSRATLVGLPEAVCKFMFSFDLQRFSSGTGALTESQEELWPPGPSEPKHGSEKPDQDDGPTDR